MISIKAIFCVLAVVLLSFVNSFAQTNLYTGNQNRIVVFARFNGDPEIDTPRNHFETMFNGNEHSLLSYFKAISNDKLTVNSVLYPEDLPSYELKYCYYCYDTSWKGSYTNCKGNDITSLYDINIGYIIRELATKLESSGNLPDAADMDIDNDGYVDNFVIVFRGAGRGPGKGVHTPQIGTVSTTFTNANGDILLNRKIIRNYTITYERNSLETHCRFFLSYLGFPNQYRNLKTLPRATGQWDPMDGPLLSYPLVYNRMKYTNGNWIDNIPQITETGIYTLNSAGSPTNNAYKLLSSTGNEFWVMEYRDKNVTWDSSILESGLIIYRVNPAYNGSIGANAEIYLYRKNGSPSVSGDIADAPFSNLNGRIVFNSGSNPFAFMSDGSISQDINISNITFQNDKMSFSVNKVYVGTNNMLTETWNVYPSISGSTALNVKGDGVEKLSLYSISGQLLADYDVRTEKIITLLQPLHGIIVVKLSGITDEKVFKVVLP